MTIVPPHRVAMLRGPAKPGLAGGLGLGLGLGLLCSGACGDNRAPAATPDAGPVPCVAHFSGNFAETSTSAACATIASGSAAPPQASLSLSIPSTTLGGPVAVTIDLGSAPAPGDFAPESVPSWSARAFENVGMGACVYLAGNTAIPQGNFALSLAEVDANAGTAHGTLVLDQSVLAFPGTDCGAVDTERTAVSF